VWDAIGKTVAALLAVVVGVVALVTGDAAALVVIVGAVVLAATAIISLIKTWYDFDQTLKELDEAKKDAGKAVGTTLIQDPKGFFDKPLITDKSPDPYRILSGPLEGGFTGDAGDGKNSTTEGLIIIGLLALTL
jgi:hypothetical protein